MQNNKFIHIIKKIVWAILITVFIFIVSCTIYMYWQKNVEDDPYPTIFGFNYSVVISGSMDPTIKVNDIIITQEQPEYNVDDIIVYTDAENIIVVHRLIDITDAGEYITKGDANNINDKPISKDAIKGKVIWTIPKIGSAF